MVGMTAFFASETETDAVFGGDDDVVQMGLAGIVFAQLAVVVAGASLITSEFATGMIRTTLTATQGRLRVLLAKAVVLSVVVFPSALLASAVGFVIAQSLLHDRGYVAPAYPPVSITDPGAARAVSAPVSCSRRTRSSPSASARSCVTPARRSPPASGSSSCRFCSSVRFRSTSRGASRSSRRSPAWRSSRRPIAC